MAAFRLAQRGLWWDSFRVMWTGRFSQATADLVLQYGESVSYDWKLYRHDIAGSIAHARAQLLVKGDAHFLGGMQIGLPHIVHDDRRPEQVQLHLPVHIPQKTAAGAFQSGGIASDELLSQQLGDGRGTLGDHGAHLGFALHADELIREIIDADPILVTVFHTIQLIDQRIVEEGVKVQGTDMILVVFIAIGIALQRTVQHAGKHLILQRRDEILELMPKGYGNTHVSVLPSMR